MALIDSISDTLSEIDTLLAQYLEDEVQIHNEEDKSRGNNPSCNHRDISDDLFYRIQRAGDRLVSMAPQLIPNSTSNMAESRTSVVNLMVENFTTGFRGFFSSIVHMVLH